MNEISARTLRAAGWVIALDEVLGFASAMPEQDQPSHNAHDSFAPLTGACTCGAVRYKLTRRPLFVHCCHCTWCQRETGSAFVLNALIEAEAVSLFGTPPVLRAVPSASGKGQKIYRCATCEVAVWSTYPGFGSAVRFVRVGTLDDPSACPPDIHIFTSTKLPWVRVPDGAVALPEYYRRSEHWPAQALARLDAVR